VAGGQLRAIGRTIFRAVFSCLSDCQLLSPESGACCPFRAGFYASLTERAECWPAVPEQSGSPRRFFMATTVEREASTSSVVATSNASGAEGSRAARASSAEWAQNGKGRFYLGIVFAAALVCCRFESSGDDHAERPSAPPQLQGIAGELKGMTAASVRDVPRMYDPPKSTGLYGILDSIDDWIDENVLVSWKAEFESESRHKIPGPDEDAFKPHVMRLSFFGLLVVSSGAVSVWLIKRYTC
jgi:hypothetical protein